jgi:hypothetical protein
MKESFKNHTLLMLWNPEQHIIDLFVLVTAFSSVRPLWGQRDYHEVSRDRFRIGIESERFSVSLMLHTYVICAFTM